MKPETAKLYSRSPTNPVRPIMAPEVMVEQVSANANWKSQNGQERDAGGLISRRRVLQEEPVIADEAVAVAEHEGKAEGEEQRPHRQVSTMHSISTLTVSRERQKPASSIVKPTCMPKTRNAATSVQTVFIGLTMSLPLRTGSAA